MTGLSVVKDAPHLFSSLVIMNTGVPTGFDFADKKELLKVLDLHISKGLFQRSPVDLFK